MKIKLHNSVLKTDNCDNYIFDDKFIVVKVYLQKGACRRYHMLGKDFFLLLYQKKMEFAKIEEFDRYRKYMNCLRTPGYAWKEMSD